METPESTYIEDAWFDKLLDKTDNCRNLREFVYKVFGRKLEKNQYWALRDMLDPSIRLIYYTSSRQSGKTETIALFQALSAMFPHKIIPFYDGRGNCYVFAPKQEQAQISFERFSNFVHFNNYSLYANYIEIDKADRIKFSNGFEVRAITASRNAEIEGLTTHIIILDESQAISPYKVRECLTGDTIIPLADGSYKTLREVVENKLNVLTTNGEEKPIKHFAHDEDTIYQITLVNGKTLKCNGNHTHLVFHKNWRDTKEGPVRKLITTDLKVGHRLAIVKSLPYFGSNGDYSAGFTVGSFIGNYTTKVKKGIANKAWSKEFLKGFIIGLIESGGHISVKEKQRGFISFSAISENLIKQLQDYLLKFGIHSSIDSKKVLNYGNKKLYTLIIRDSDDIIDFHNTFTLTTKQNKLVNLYNQRKSSSSRYSSKHYSDNIRFSRIKSIKKLDKKEPVYCVQVANPNLWIANGVVTGNSILPMGGGIKGGAKIIQTGVPGILGSHFHKAYKNKYDKEANKYGYVQHIYPWMECPRLDKHYVMSIRGDEEAFARNYELTWAKNNFGYFITMEQYESCELNYNPNDMIKNAVEEGWGFHWGLDFAKYKDSTVLTTMVECPMDCKVGDINCRAGDFYLVGLVELQGVDYQSQIGYFKNAYVPGRVVHICADKTAVGDPIVEQMNESGMRTTGVVFNMQSKDKIYKNFRHWISNQQVHWPKQAGSFSKELQRFKQQMIELELEYKPTGLISVHHNLDDNMARDDYPDSACLCIWSGAEYVEPKIYYGE